jgi:hypothetical protein
MVTVTGGVIFGSAAGCVTYALLYLAFAARNQHMGFHGDFEAAAASCARLSVFFAATTVTAVASSVVRGAARARARARARAKTSAFLSGGDGDRFSDAVLPGSYTGLRKR